LLKSIVSEGFGETSPGSLLLPYSIIPPVGGLYAKKCPKYGYMALSDGRGNRGIFETSCKSWRCSVCQNKKLGLMIEMMKYGCSTHEQSFSITLTFTMASGEHRDAAFVEAGLRAFSRRFRKLYPSANWVKVLELTKRGQPHFHLLLGGVGLQKASCRIRPYQTLKHITGACRANNRCLEHLVHDAWVKSVPDSPIVFVTDVYDLSGLGRYFAKYLTKTFTGTFDAASLGFGRRWSTTRNFPRVPRMELRGTVDGSWSVVQHSRGRLMANWRTEFYGHGQHQEGPFEPVGTELARRMADYKMKKQLASVGKRLLNGNSS